MNRTSWVTDLSNMAVVAAVLIGFSMSSAQADFLTPTDATASPTLRAASRAITPGHLSSNDINATHGSGNEWLSLNPPTDHWIRFELDDVYDLSKIYLWNVYENNETDRGISNFTVLVSLDGSTWTAPTSGGSQTATKEVQGVLPVQMQTMSMASTNTRYVLFTNLTNHADPSFVGIGEVRFEGVLTPDTTPPGLVTLSPENGAVGVGVNADLEITFDDSITNGTGNITIKTVAGGSVVETYAAATSPRLTWDYGSGRSVTIDPTSDLDTKTAYYVEIDNGAIDDDAGNPYAGFTGAGTWSFTTSGPLITNTTVKDFSSDWPGRLVGNAISGNGLPGGVPSLYGVHSAAAGAQWLTHITGGDPTPSLGFIVVDLGDNYVLDTIHVWNYNESGATFSMKDVEISVSSTTDTNDLVTLTTDGTGATDDGSGGYLFPQGFNANYLGFNVDLTSLTDASPLGNVRLVEIRNSTTYGGNGAGLAEVHFGGELWTAAPAGTVITLR